VRRAPLGSSSWICRARASSVRAHPSPDGARELLMDAGRDRPAPRRYSWSFSTSSGAAVATSSNSTAASAPGSSSTSNTRPPPRTRIGPFGPASPRGRDGVRLPFGGAGGPKFRSRRPPGSPPEAGGPPMGMDGGPDGRYPGPRSSLGRASLTDNGRPWKGCPFKRRMTSAATASSAYSTKAKPRGRPVSRSTGKATDSGGATVAT
jgi:hypothetical protein